MGQQLIGKQILSIQIGRPIAVTNEPIINPNNLKIEGWHATDIGTKSRVILLSQDIRDILLNGFAVNDYNSLTPKDELIRLKPVMDQDFNLINKKVSTTRHIRLGKISDYAIDKDSLYIQKLYVSQPIYKNFSGGALIIDRNQIVKITNQAIIVDDASIKDSSPVVAPA